MAVRAEWLQLGLVTVVTKMFPTKRCCSCNMQLDLSGYWSTGLDWTGVEWRGSYYYYFVSIV